MAFATVFLAPAEAMIKFYTSRDPAVLAAVARELDYKRIGVLETAGAGEAACEEVFDLSNNPSRQEERDLRWGRNRSLSVGDVVNVDGESYLCCSIGWTKLD